MNGTEFEHSHFEQRVRTLLNESIDTELGYQRPAPQFVESAERRHGPKSRWIVPLLAAACVAVVVAATLGLTALFRADGGHNGGPADLPPGPIVVLSGARIALPAGWTARGARSTLIPNEHRRVPNAWCLVPTGSRPGDCAIGLRARSRQSWSDGNLDVNSDSNLVPHCGRELKLVEHVGEVPFGGRLSEYRRWDYSCPDKPPSQIEQYAAPYLPDYVLFSDAATSSVSHVMSYIAAHSTLPNPVSALPLADYGKIVQVTHTPHGDKIVLQRGIRTDHAPGGTQIVYGQVSPVQIRYDLTPVYRGFEARSPAPPAFAMARLRVHVGDHIEIATDGNQVESYLKA